jgi:hypothetical protein
MHFLNHGSKLSAAVELEHWADFFRQGHAAQKVGNTFIQRAAGIAVRRQGYGHGPIQAEGFPLASISGIKPAFEITQRPEALELMRSICGASFIFVLEAGTNRVNHNFPA